MRTTRAGRPSERASAGHHAPSSACRTLGVALFLAGAVGPVLAQGAFVRVTADGGSSAVVAPGTPVQIEVQPGYLIGLQVATVTGSVRVEGDAGVGSNFAFNLGAGPLIHTGSFVGGSRVGIDVGSGPPPFFGINPLWSNQPIRMMRYDLTISDPGTYQVTWEPPPTGPVMSVWLPGGVLASYTPQEVQIDGATITVTPAPGAAAVFLGVLALGPERRRVR